MTASAVFYLSLRWFYQDLNRHKGTTITTKKKTKQKNYSPWNDFQQTWILGAFSSSYYVCQGLREGRYVA